MRKSSRRKAPSGLDTRSKLPVSPPQKMESCISKPFSSVNFYGKKIPENTNTKLIITVSRINSASIPSDINISLSTTQSINRPKLSARKRRRKSSFGSNNAGHKVKVKKKLICKSENKCPEERDSRPTRKAFAQAVKSIANTENGASTDDSSTCKRIHRVRKTAEMKERESIEKELRAQSRREKRIMEHTHKREKQIRKEKRLREKGIEKRSVPKREAAAQVAKKVAMAYHSSSSDDENYDKKAKEDKPEEATPPTPKFSEYEKAARSKIALRLKFLKALNKVNT